ncbi:hypothetical protein Btru_032909 [Bulinus truncatus]|nr:hypothetical protein Btru_032909 [Bulinus truncatus]
MLGITLDPCAMKDVQAFSYLGRCFKLVSDSRLPWGQAQVRHPLFVVDVWIGANDIVREGTFVWASNNSTMLHTLWPPVAGVVLGGDHRVVLGGDHRVVLGGDHRVVLGGDHRVVLGGDHRVVLGADHRVVLGADHRVALGGDHRVVLGGDHRVVLGGDHRVVLGGDHRVVLGGDHRVVLDPCYLVLPNSYYGFGQCFNYFDSQLTWENAKEFCLNISSYLAEPETFEMYQLVSDYVGNKPAWLGAKYTADQEIFSWVVSQNAVNSTFGTGPFNSRLWIQSGTMYLNGSIEETRGFVCQTAAVAPNAQTYVAVLPNLYELSSREMKLVVTSNFTSVMYLKFQFLHSKQTKFTTRSPLTPDGAVTYPVFELIQTGKIDHVFVEVNATQPVTVVQYITDQSLDQASATLLYPAPIDSPDDPMMTSYLLLSTLPDNNDTTFTLTSLFNDSTEVTLLFEVENSSRVVFLEDKPVKISQVDNITTSLESQYESFQMKMIEKLNGSYLYSTLPVKVLLTTTTISHENKSIVIENATTTHEISLDSGELNYIVGNESFIAYLFYSGMAAIGLQNIPKDLIFMRYPGKHQHVCVTTLLPSSLWRDEYQFFKAGDRLTLTVYVIVDVNMTHDIEVNGIKESWSCDTIPGTSYSGCNKTLPKYVTYLRLQLANRQGPFGAYMVGSTKRSTFCNPLGIRDDVNTSRLGNMIWCDMYDLYDVFDMFDMFDLYDVFDMYVLYDVFDMFDMFDMYDLYDVFDMFDMFDMYELYDVFDMFDMYDLYDVFDMYVLYDVFDMFDMFDMYDLYDVFDMFDMFDMVLRQDKHTRSLYDDSCKMYPCKVTTSVKFQAVSGVTSDVSWITAANISQKIPKLQTREELVKFLKVENRNLSSFRRGKTLDPCLDKNEPTAALLYGKCVQLVTDLNLTWSNAQAYWVTYIGCEVTFIVCDVTYTGCEVTYIVCDVTYTGCEVTYTGCEVTYKVWDVTYTGCEVTYTGCEVTYIGCEVTYTGCEVTYIGCEVTYIVCDVTYTGCEVTYIGCEVTYIGCEVTYTGCEVTYIGCEVTYIGCEVTYIVCDVTYTGCEVTYTGCEVTYIVCDVTYTGCEVTYIGCEVTYIVCDVTYTGCEVTYTGCEVTYIVCDVTYTGCEVTYIGCEVTYIVCDVTYTGCEVTYIVCDVTYTGCEVTYIGCEVTYTGCEVTYIGCEVTYTGCEVTYIHCVVAYTGCGATWQYICVLNVSAHAR